MVEVNDDVKQTLTRTVSQPSSTAPIAIGLGLLVGGGIAYKVWLEKEKQKAADKALMGVQTAKTEVDKLVNSVLEKNKEAKDQSTVATNTTTQAIVKAEESLDAIIAREWEQAYIAVYDLTLQLYDANIANANVQKQLAWQRDEAAKLAVAKAKEDQEQKTGQKVLQGIITLGIWGIVENEEDKKKIKAAEDNYAKVKREVQDEVNNLDARIRDLNAKKQDFMSRRGSVYNQAKASFENNRRTSNYNYAVSSTQQLVRRIAN